MAVMIRLQTKRKRLEILWVSMSDCAADLYKESSMQCDVGDEALCVQRLRAANTARLADNSHAEVTLLWISNLNFNIKSRPTSQSLTPCKLPNVQIRQGFQVVTYE